MTQAAQLAQYGANNVGLSFKNRIINGDMTIDQRNAGALVSNANGFITDRWSLAKFDATGGAYSGQQITDAPTGFTNSLRVTVTTSVAQSADQYWQAFQKIEGFNTADLAFGTANAQTVTVSFWVKSSVTGTYSVSLFNDGFGSTNRAYVTTYTINAANTWEQKSVTITGDGTAGAGYWGTTNGAGIGVYFDLGCGTNQQATANTWTTSNARRVSGTVRLMATGSATWQVTGVQLEKGTVATSFDYLPYTTELQLCQRYYWRIAQTASNAYYPISGLCRTTTASRNTVQFPVAMRVAPTSLSTTGSAGDYRLYLGNTEADCSVAPSLSDVTTLGGVINLTVASGLTAGQISLLASGVGSTTSFLAWSAEL
jgi:hypothetical protein